MLRLLVLCLGSLLMVVPAQAQRAVIPNEEIAAILAERIDAQKLSVGMVVGVIEPSGTRIVAHGTMGIGDPRPVDADTVFEIGSISKVFTALLLADAARRGQVRLDQPVADLLPDGTIVPGRNSRAITLIDLATHTSGLPRMPSNFAPADPMDPYADYDAQRLYAFLAGHTLSRDIGGTFEYSNVGGGLLGQALSVNAGTDYETLVHERVLQPLGLNDTMITLTPVLDGRLAKGHDGQLKPVANWSFDALAAAGALRSTANDMLKFLAAAMGRAPNPLSVAFGDLVEVSRPIEPGSTIGLGWLKLVRGDDEIVWHNGGTGGYRSFIGFLRRAGVGVVVLSNSGAAIGGDDIGMHLLDPALPLAPPPSVHTEVKIDPAILDRYVGSYEAAPQFVLTVTREGDALFVQATGQERLPVFPESETGFFYKVVDAQISFAVSPEGQVTGLVLHQAGRDLPAPRRDP